MFEQRRLILIDLENFMGGPIDSRKLADEGYGIVSDLLHPNEHDLMVVAVDQGALTNIHGAFSHSRLLGGHGKDGADKELLVVLSEDIADRFQNVVIVSGDHIFAQPARQLVKQGVSVTVVADARSLSKSLMFAADKVVWHQCPDREYPQECYTLAA